MCLLRLRWFIVVAQTSYWCACRGFGNGACAPPSRDESQVFQYKSADRHHTKGWPQIGGSATKRWQTFRLHALVFHLSRHRNISLFSHRFWFLPLAFSRFAEHSVGNIVRKLLHHIREEYHTATGQNATAPVAQAGSQFSIAKFVLQGQPRKHHVAVQKASEIRGTLKEDDPNDPDSFARGLKPVIMEAIQDVLDELETVYDNVSKNARDHIHSE